MKFLLACDQRSDPTLLAAYLASRLNGRNGDIDVDILTVIAGVEEASDDTDVNGNVIGISETSRDYRSACAFVATIAQELKQLGLKSVRTHVEYGDPADVILSSSRLWRSDLLLVGAPRRAGLLTAFRLEGVTRRLLRWSDCPVELLRPEAQAARDDLLLLPLPVDAAGRLPVPRLLGLPWRNGSRLHLVGVLPEPLDESLAEASPAAMLLALQNARDASTRAEAVMAGLQAQLAAVLPEGVHITHEVAEGQLHEVTVHRAGELKPSLLVLSQCSFEHAGASPLHAMSPAALALCVSASVLLLQDGDAAAGLPRRKADTARILKLAR